MSYENPWRFNGEVFESSDIEDYFGFVYHIHCDKTGRSYIGRKYFLGSCHTFNFARDI